MIVGIVVGVVVVIAAIATVVVCMKKNKGKRASTNSMKKMTA